MEQIKTSFDFEKPLAELVQQIEKVKQVADKTKVDMSATLTELEEKIVETQKDLYSNLTTLVYLYMITCLKRCLLSSPDLPRAAITGINVLPNSVRETGI